MTWRRTKLTHSKIGAIKTCAVGEFLVGKLDTTSSNKEE